MDLWTFLLEVVMLLAGAFLLGALAQRLRQSPIVGYLLAGAIIGPILFSAQIVSQTAELGVALLLFSIGLEFSFKRLRIMGRMAFGGGTLQVAVTLTVVALAASLAASWPRAITIGAIVALSSTAVVMRVLVDRAEIDSVRGRTCLAILLLQDIAIVPLVLTISLFLPEAAEVSIGRHILKISAAAIGLGAALYLLFYHLVPVLLSARGMFANRELAVLLAIAAALSSAWAAHSLGISPALGAFVAGIMLGESDFAAQIRADIDALRIVMVTLFFASVGMLAKPTWFLAHAHWVLLAAGTIFVVKALIVYVITRIFGLDNRHALATGITLGQIGEFSFVLAATARKGGLLGDALFDLIVSTTIVLMFAAPYMVSMAFLLTDRLLSLFGKRAVYPGKEGPEPGVEEAGGVLVVGFGPAAREVVAHLLNEQLEPVIIDLNPQSRQDALKMGLPLHLGDASNPEILQHAKLNQACMAVVTLPDPTTAIRVIEALKTMRPGLPIAARCRYNRHIGDLEKAGADIVIDEETTIGHTLARHIVHFLQEASGTTLACRMSGRPMPQSDPSRKSAEVQTE
jgi:CPA2 family monovalent cation:H+ antiporter-2